MKGAHVLNQTCSKYRLPLIHFEFLFRSLKDVKPLNRFSCLVVIGDENQDGLLQGFQALEVAAELAVVDILVAMATFEGRISPVQVTPD